LVELADFVMLTTTAALLAITVAIGIRYYMLICKARGEYLKARDLVEEIVRSFNRELKRDSQKIDAVGYKIEGNAARIEEATRRVSDFERRVAPLDGKVAAVDGQMATVVQDIKETEAAIAETSSKMQSVAEEHENLKAKVAALQEQIDKLSTLPEVKAEPVIPIRRDKAMAALTDTEITVLEMLAAEGAKTAPEIKERVLLSREHTARLMKKLYEEGYLERETDKIPFKYNVKKEMERFLKKPENPQA
jgi:chromosome segregation ATPase